MPGRQPLHTPEREFFIDNLLARIHFIIVMIWWTGLAPWEFETPFPGSLISIFLDCLQPPAQWDQIVCFNCLDVYHKSPDSGER